MDQQPNESDPNVVLPFEPITDPKTFGLFPDEFPDDANVLEMCRSDTYLFLAYESIAKLDQLKRLGQAGSDYLDQKSRHTKFFDERQKFLDENPRP